MLLRLEDPKVWDDPQEAQQLGQERASLEASTTALDELAIKAEEASELLAMAREEEDSESLELIAAETEQAFLLLEKLEFLRMFSGELDDANAFVDIQAGSGGTEAQDWADMLLRMYLRWAEDEGLGTELVERSDGEVAGIKSATIQVRGEYAFGKLRTETGVHRLVRKSPFDSGNRRHTSFASVFVYPEVDESVEIEIYKEADANIVAVEDQIELRFSEGGRNLILNDLDPSAIANIGIAVFNAGDAANIDAHRRIEGQGPTAGRRLRTTEHDTDLFSQLVDKDDDGFGFI